MTRAGDCVLGIDLTVDHELLLAIKEHLDEIDAALGR
jgi:hypothetical protein